MPSNSFWNPSITDRMAQSLNSQQAMMQSSTNMIGRIDSYDNSYQINPGVFRDYGMGQYRGFTTTWASSAGIPSDASEEKKNKVGAKVLDKIKAAARPFTVTEKDGEQAISKADEYRNLGLIGIAEIVEQKTSKILREMSISAAGYKRINRAELNSFCQELEAVSDMTSKRKLLETPLKYYLGAGITEGQAVKDTELAVPPADVLEKLKIARDAKLFDDYAVLHIQYVPDPILCGKINESNDLYFIAEWGDDVKLTDIIK